MLIRVSSYLFRGVLWYIEVGCTLPLVKVKKEWKLLCGGRNSIIQHESYRVVFKYLWFNDRLRKGIINMKFCYIVYNQDGINILIYHWIRKWKKKKKNKQQKTLHCGNRSKIESKNRRNWAKIDTLNAHILDPALSWFGAGRLIKGGGAKRVFLLKTFTDYCLNLGILYPPTREFITFVLKYILSLYYTFVTPGM